MNPLSLFAFEYALLYIYMTMSSDNASYAPLSTQTVRTLTDKLYEKRKAAALDIEKMMRDYVTSNQLSQVDRVLDVLNDLARSPNPNNRKGGLIGMAAAAIALGKLTAKYTDQLILPVLDCFNDADSRVRYYACESLYNIVKVTREAALKHFGPLFDTLCRLAADTDQNVRSGSDLLDRLMKDIVTSTKSFQIAEFMVLLRERIHTKNSSVRRFLISWLSSLYRVPEINLLPYLPEILDGLLQSLSDPTLMVRETCEAVLGQFLASIKTNSADIELEHMVNVLIVHAQAPDELVRYISLVWLREFVSIKKSQMLPYSSGIMIAVLPCLAMPDDLQRDIHNVAKNVNLNLMRLINEENEAVKNLNLASVIEVLERHLNHEAVQTRVSVLKWIHHLHNKMPNEVFPHMERLFPVLLKMLSDTADEVVLLDLEVLSEVCQGSNANNSLDSLSIGENSKRQLKGVVSALFVKFVGSLLEMFHKDGALLAQRGSFIVRQLCLLLRAEDVFRCLAVLLCEDEDALFVAEMVQALNAILLTATELFPLRNRLKTAAIRVVNTAASPSQGGGADAVSGAECRELFRCLYWCWCEAPLAAVGLCLLAGAYTHAARLVRQLTDADVTVDLLADVDRLVQLLESPIFAYVRLHLLDADHQKPLSSVLYGLLMLLPQTEAFHTLHRRLQCLPPPSGAAAAQATTPSRSQKKPDSMWEMDFEPLFQHFLVVQDKHKQFRRLKHRELLSRNA